MIKTFTYLPVGTCSKKMEISIDTETKKITDFKVFGGCPGNLGGIKRLVIGMDALEVADKLSGVTCGFKNTSCPDQLANGIRELFKEIN